MSAIYNKFWLVLISGAIVLSGCSTYHDQTGNIRVFIESGDYTAASEATDELSTDGKGIGCSTTWSPAWFNT